MKKDKLLFIIAIFVCLPIFCGMLLFCVYPLKYKKYITYFSLQYNIEKSLIASVICAESRFNKNAESASGACGLMQLMPNTYYWICNELNQCSADIFDPEVNIEAGCFYLKYLLDKYKNLVYALACYNAGEGVVSAWGSPVNFEISNIKYQETREYVGKVLKFKLLYKHRF